jgi:hypothetical protein
MDKAKGFKEATAKITYADVINMFNSLNKILHGEYYSDSKNLKRPEGGSAIGFVYTGYAAGAGLRKILDTLNIKYSTNIKGGNGVTEKSEILIDAKDEKRMADIIEKIGHLQSNVSREIQVSGNQALNNQLFQQVR